MRAAPPNVAVGLERNGSYKMAGTKEVTMVEFENDTHAAVKAQIYERARSGQAYDVDTAEAIATWEAANFMAYWYGWSAPEFTLEDLLK